MSQTTITPEATGLPSVASTTEAILSAQQETLHNMGAASAVLLEGLTKVQAEIADFIAERIRQDVETQADMLSCRNLDDVRDLQTRFFRTALDQYAAEVSRLMKISTDTMERSFETHAH
jgi:hypothetical protein